MKFCCKEMELFVADPREPIKYDKVFREYYIKSFRKTRVITFAYCPWCGLQLAKELRDEFFDTLEQEYNIEVDIFEYKKADLPVEFRSDEWWRKRGL